MYVYNRIMITIIIVIMMIRMMILMISNDSFNMFYFYGGFH